MIVTSNWLLSKLGNACTSNNSTLGSKFLIDSLISSTITDAVMSSIFSKRTYEILDPKVGLKNFSPGKVKTIFFTERAMAFSFLMAIRSSFRGLA